MKKITDNEIRMQGIEALIDSMGEVQAERFINLLMREPFDYTEWQRQLWPEKSVQEISKMAMKSINENT